MNETAPEPGAQDDRARSTEETGPEPRAPSLAASTEETRPEPHARDDVAEPAGAKKLPSLDPRQVAEAIVDDPGPTEAPGPLAAPRPRRPPRIRSELRPAGAAGFKSDEEAFVARTARDGTVAIDDRPSFGVDLPGPTELAKRMAGAVERWARNPRRYAEETGNRTPPLVDGRFEVNDWIMRMAGQDPYTARKVDFLDRTRDERMGIAATEKSENLRASIARTRADLARLWRGPGSAAEKRRLIFLMWDECAESGSEQILNTARAVRATIVAFVKRQLPAGTRTGYTDAELARYNAQRTSTERFAPYPAQP